MISRRFSVILPTHIMAGLVILFVFGSCSKVDFESNIGQKCEDPDCVALKDGETVRLDFNYKYVIPERKADVLFVIDNSESMKPEQQRLGMAFRSLGTSLQGIDWQVAITTTDVGLSGGSLMPFESVNMNVLSPEVAQFQEIFENTLTQQGDSGSDNEQGLVAALKVFENKETLGFPRAGSFSVVIILSDEDEGSFLPSSASSQLATQYVERMNHLAGRGRHSLYPIIIRPGDKTCLGSQMNPRRGYFGLTYFEAQRILFSECFSQKLTNASPELGDICQNNYSAIIESFAQSIRSKIEPIILKCIPQDGTLEIDPKVNFTLNGATVKIIPQPEPGESYWLKYRCAAES